MNKIWIVLSGLSLIIGLYFIAGSLSYLYEYYITPPNPYRGEYLQGFALSVILSIPFWLASSGFIYPVKKHYPAALSNSIFIVTATICILFLSSFIYSIVGSIYFT
jgi:hypothetical protein